MFVLIFISFTCYQNGFVLDKILNVHFWPFRLRFFNGPESSPGCGDGELDNGWWTLKWIYFDSTISLSCSYCCFCLFLYNHLIYSLKLKPLPPVFIHTSSLFWRTLFWCLTFVLHLTKIIQNIMEDCVTDWWNHT